MVVDGAQSFVTVPATMAYYIIEYKAYSPFESAVFTHTYYHGSIVLERKLDKINSSDHPFISLWEDLVSFSRGWWIHLDWCPVLLLRFISLFFFHVRGVYKIGLQEEICFFFGFDSHYDYLHIC